MEDEEMTLPLDQAPPDAETILTVSEVNRMAKQALEGIRVTVRGEASGLNTRYPYYVYLSLRDSEATLPAIVPKRLFDSLDFKLEDGASVVVEGVLTLYEKQGRYQVRVSEMRLFGVGEIQRRIEMIKKKLQAEGLFDDARKKPLPAFPERIGVVTSPRGAAVRDVTTTIARRFPPASVFVRGVRVQGVGAVEQICAGLRFFDSDFPVDLVILARGGGSIEDLEPFSTEEVARAVARMRLPVITGIGHEPDVSIADLVADRWASTPTSAAQAAVPDCPHVRSMLRSSAVAMRGHVAARGQSDRRQLAGIKRLPLYRGVDFLLGRFMQRWERASKALPESPRRGLERSRYRLRVIVSRPVFGRPDEMLARQRIALERAKARVTALSPLAVLKRGYSITLEKSTGKVVRSAADVVVGAALKIKLESGVLDAEVTGKE
ncbi:MAG: exodeoxyribonuclease VII large subunit [Candidatus Anoxymicrobium japonicum]|uniref:Exodeoxyribonuclease 7 large subunit n=1 Tax=Candidatus Anoxymicrobium japonicum TaxID=2013648 RepID=A0A2N3G7M7_9ACTN|nr:MAG: exodeoxyribonuclease VII large subunit [Candidatus Anoxymicrobium japonicum]